ncbi:MAG: hypothetical protein ACRDM8_02275 [Gaiellaceae bacterium]
MIQNSNAYEEGFTAAWDVIRHALWVNRSPETEEPLKAFLELDGAHVWAAGGSRPLLRPLGALVDIVVVVGFVPPGAKRHVGPEEGPEVPPRAASES